MAGEEVQENQQVTCPKLEGFSPDSDLFGAAWGPGAKVEPCKPENTASGLPNLTLFDSQCGQLANADGTPACTNEGPGKDVREPSGPDVQGGGRGDRAKKEQSAGDAEKSKEYSEPEAAAKKPSEQNPTSLSDRLKGLFSRNLDGGRAPKTTELPPLP